jgi:sugar lactone lactonase YvrE
MASVDEGVKLTMLEWLQERAYEMEASLADVAPSELDGRRSELLTQHFTEAERAAGQRGFTLPSLAANWGWFNLAEPLSADHFRGRLVLFDFFTYCCVNCLHILPDLEALEEAYPPTDSRLLVVGVHSPKFERERLDAAVGAAVRRHGIRHAVVNDAGATWWRKLGVSCWPTLLLVSPKGSPIAVFVGEGHGRTLAATVAAALDFYKDSPPPPLMLPTLVQGDGQAVRKSFLRFPGKVLVADDILYVADSGQHRVVECRVSDGAVQRVFGVLERGFADGDAEEVRFASPQGLAKVANTLYVADTENHAIRAIDLSTGKVTTVCGTGQQGTDKEGGRPGLQQPLATPWDLCVGASPQSEALDTLFIAVAGTHQIWALALAPSSWWKGTRRESGVCFAVAGSGREENRNNAYPSKASFAQPSGLSYSHSERALYVADSESSSVRKILLNEGGSVKAVCGGARDPTDLFAYGDADGKGVDAKLQHPLGVARDDDENVTYVTDTYNHKVKKVTGQAISTVAGEGAAGDVVGELSSAKFNEPGGLDVVNGHIYVADTNNHSIKKIDISNATVSVVPIGLAVENPDAVDAPSDGVKCPVAIKAGMNESDISFVLHLPSGVHLNKEAPNGWKFVEGRGWRTKDKSGSVTGNKWTVSLLRHDLEASDRDGVMLKIDLITCDDATKTCGMVSETLILQLLTDKATTNEKPSEVSLAMVNGKICLRR